MAESDENKETHGYKLKVKHLIYAVLALVAAIIVSVLAISYLSGSPSVATLGNGWHEVAGTQAFTVNNKLYVSFIGIEGCEFCAAERYAIFGALSNFGNWTYYGQRLSLDALPVNNLTTGSEPSADAIFYKAAEGDWTLNFLSPNLVYTSQYVDFSTAESLDNAYNPLQSLDAIQQGYISKYDSGESVPFTVIGGNFYEIGAGNSLAPNGVPILFRSNGTGYLPSYIISNFDTSGSSINVAINTEVNYITAIICFDIMNSAPICSNSTIAAISSKL